MENIYESSNMSGLAHVSCIKYQNLNNISHYHSDHELVYIDRGVAEITVNDKVFNMHSGECIFIHSSDIHQIRSDASTIITVLKAGNVYFENVFGSKRLLSPIIKYSLDVKTVLNEIWSELNIHVDNGDILANCVAAKFFITMLRNEPTFLQKNAVSITHNTKELYNKICRKISTEYCTITFEEIAKYVGFSEPYFSKVFHNLFGMTFTQYLNTVRIAAAIERLKQGNINITTVSAECGFSTIRNFNRVFKKFTGYSPCNLPQDYNFLYDLREGYGLNPTLNCTEILEYQTLYADNSPNTCYSLPQK